VLAVGKRKHVGGHDASQMARCLDRTQAGADREDGQQISFGGAFDLWFGIGSRTEMVGKVRQMLHVDEDVKQAALGHAPHHLKVQPLRGFGNDTSAVLKQNRQAIGTHLYRRVLRKLLIDSGGKLRQLLAVGARR